MARKPAPTKAIEPQPTFNVNGAPVTATALRPWTDAEKRLPLWLRANRLPRHVADPVEQVFLKDELPGPLANLWAMVNLARGAECGILTVRRDHGTKPDAMDPAVFVQYVVFMLRNARDDVLKQTAAANIPVVSARLDALIGATKATLDAFMADNLDKIWCDNPTCDKRGRHLLPGPWIDAMKRSGEAIEEAFRLSTFVGGDTTPTVSVSPDLLVRLQRAAAAVDPGAIDRAAERAAEKIARVFGAGDNGHTKPPALPAGADESAGPALTVNQSRVLQTMALFDASRLLSSKMIAEKMDATERLSEETVRQCVRKLIDANLAERPEGDRSGARLNNAGRKLAGKIAD